MDLALNNLQRLICHKTQQTNKQYVCVYIYACVCVCERERMRERVKEGEREREREREREARWLIERLINSNGMPTRHLIIFFAERLTKGLHK